MGCICSVLASLISHILYFSQKFLYCFTCAALVTCLVVTIILTLGMGIGIGYNYCFIDFKTKHRYVPAKYRKYNPTPHWRRAALNVTVPQSVNENKFDDTENVTEAVSTNTSIINIFKEEHLKDELEETAASKMVEKSIIAETTEDSPKMIIPISGLDLIALLSKLRSENRNYSLQIVTT